MMSPEQVLSSAPPELIARLLDKRQIRIRKRWAIIQLNLWLQQGWVTAQSEGIFLLTDASKISANCLPSVVPEKINIRFIYDILF
jgi:hypothetical protein